MENTSFQILENSQPQGVGGTDQGGRYIGGIIGGRSRPI